MKGYCLPVGVDTVPPLRVAALTLLATSAIWVICMVQVPGLWMTVLGLLQLMVAFPVFKLWFDYRQFVVLQIGTNSQAALLADDEQRLEVGLGAIMEFGPWMLIMVQIRRAQLPFVVAR